MWVLDAAVPPQPIFVQRRDWQHDLTKMDDITREETETLEMLYRHRLEFAVGHGASVHTTLPQPEAIKALTLETEFVPRSEVEQQTPPTPADDANLTGVVLDMKELAQMSKADLLATLRKLKDAYASWIQKETGKISNPTERLAEHQAAAQGAVERCERACTRISEGIDLIENDPLAEDSFRFVMSALSLPPTSQDKLTLRIADHWTALKDVPSLEVVAYVAAPSRMPELAEFTADQIWAAIQARKQGDGGDNAEEPDLKIAEWALLTQNPPAPPTKDFRATRVPPPTGFNQFFEDTLLLEKLREVRALLAFTRIESKGDFADAAYVDDGRQTPLSRQSPTWLPASEVRGEGIFLRFKESALQAWEQQPAVRQLEREFFAAHKGWRNLRKQNPPEAGFPAIRFVLIHSLSHALMRQISLECGYTAASVRERLYCRMVGQESGPMAGILIYTAASDSEGTLGGLVQLGQPVTLGRQIQNALESMRICGSDPLCAEHSPVPDGRAIHGACCHACLFAPETSCEKGNRFLDRSTLVGTFAARTVEFFNGV
jgi:hypothetical protein